MLQAAANIAAAVVVGLAAPPSRQALGLAA